MKILVWASLLVMLSLGVSQVIQAETDDGLGYAMKESTGQFRDYAPPDSWGPYPVGVRRYVYVDYTRFQFYGNRYRTLPTSIWYPAVEGTGYPNTIGDFMGELPLWVVILFQMMFGDQFWQIRDIETNAFMMAEFDGSDGPYPVIMFSHGMSSNRFQSWDQCEYLASHGFIVVAPDHYGSAMLTNTDDGVVFFNPMFMMSDLVARPKDVEFMYETLGLLTADPTHLLYQGLDLSRLGLMGHSFGGYTCLNAGPTYDFVDAIAPLNPIMIGQLPAAFAKPFFLLQADTDDICALAMDSNARSLEAFSTCAASPKVYLKLINAGHFSASNVCTLGGSRMFPNLQTGCEDGFMEIARANEIAAAYLTAFFKYCLADDQDYLGFLMTNHYSEDLEHGWWE